MTALMWAAAYNQNPDVAMTLLKAGANGKLKSSDDKTAFDYAEGNEKLKGTDASEALRKAAGK
jgi:ankyrin repeat protein